MILVNGKEEFISEEINKGSVIEFTDGRNFKIYSVEEVFELIEVLNKIKNNNNLE
jgi:hypothetical protein